MSLQVGKDWQAWMSALINALCFVPDSTSVDSLAPMSYGKASRCGGIRQDEQSLGKALAGGSRLVQPWPQSSRDPSCQVG